MQLKLSMGNPVSKVREGIREALSNQYDQERIKQEERLNLLETMITSRLELAKQNILNGDRNDQQIHAGTVVEYTRQVNIAMKNGTDTDLLDAITDFITDTGDSARNGFAKIIQVGVAAVLGNSSMGQHEGTNMFIMWTDNALLRLDAYFYRWNFTSRNVITDVEGASGVIMMKRVIDLTKTDPQVLTWAISRQANLLGKKKETSQMIDEAIAILKKVDTLQDCLRDNQPIEGVQN